MNPFGALKERWVSLSSDPSQIPTCPECGADLEDDHVRAPSQQDHWRGVPGHRCPGCGYTEARDEALAP